MYQMSSKEDLEVLRDLVTWMVEGKMSPAVVKVGSIEVRFFDEILTETSETEAKDNTKSDDDDGYDPYNPLQMAARARGIDLRRMVEDDQ